MRVQAAAKRRQAAGLRTGRVHYIPPELRKHYSKNGKAIFHKQRWRHRKW